jgi:hypothetical protein
VLGPKHPQTAMSLSNLANLLQLQNDLGGCGRSSSARWQIREKMLGPEHPATADQDGHQ